MARDSSGPKNQPRYDPLGIPADAADLTEVANYAALVGNYKSLTNSERVALSGSDRWVGLIVYETDTDLHFIYRSTGWRGLPLNDSGVVAVSTVNSFDNGDGFGVRRIGDVVYLRGGISRATPPGTTTGVRAFTLPAGYRPASQQRGLMRGGAEYLLEQNGNFTLFSSQGLTGAGWPVGHISFLAT